MSRTHCMIIIMSTIICLAVIWAATSEPPVFAHHGHAHAPASAKKLKNPTAVTEADIANGHALYQQHCASCHGDDGKAKTAKAAAMKVKPADLTGHDMHGLADGEIYWVITYGIKTSGMPAYQAKMSARERWQVTSYARRLSATSVGGLETTARRAWQGQEKEQS